MIVMSEEYFGEVDFPQDWFMSAFLGIVSMKWDVE